MLAPKRHFLEKHYLALHSGNLNAQFLEMNSLPADCKYLNFNEFISDPYSVELKMKPDIQTNKGGRQLKEVIDEKKEDIQEMVQYL